MAKKKVTKKTVITTEEIVDVNEYTHIICLLDKSGSMGFNNIIVEARNSVNSFIKAQKKKNLGKATISIYLFDDTFEEIYSMSPLKEAKKLTEEDWSPNGMTRLYDGIGKTVAIENKLIKDLTKSKRPDKILFVITTDGDENNSQEYSGNQVKDLIKKQEKSGWKFIYTAAGKDAFAAGTRIGVSAGNTLSFGNTKKGYGDFNVTLDAAVTNYRSVKSSDTIAFASMCDTMMSDAADTVNDEDDSEEEDN